jgi:hypothetical protein
MNNVSYHSYITVVIGVGGLMISNYVLVRRIVGNDLLEGLRVLRRPYNILISYLRFLSMITQRRG